MIKITPLALGLTLSLAALPALAQTDPGASTMPNSTNTPPAASQSGSGTGSSTGLSNEQAPPASSSGTRALRPGQNPDGTPREQTPGNAPQLPGMKGRN